jgi:hypothetical protein
MNESLMGFFFGLSFVFANRLMINIRIVYYEGEPSTRKTRTDKESASIPEFGVPSLDDDDDETGTTSGLDTFSTRDSISSRSRGKERAVEEITTIDQELRSTYSEELGC